LASIPARRSIRKRQVQLKPAWHIPILSVNWSTRALSKQRHTVYG